MAPEIPHVTGFKLQTYGKLRIKRYDFDVFPADLQPGRTLEEALRQMYASITEQGDLGFAFMYGYETQSGVNVAGVDLSIFGKETR